MLPLPMLPSTSGVVDNFVTAATSLVVADVAIDIVAGIAILVVIDALVVADLAYVVVIVVFVLKVVVVAPGLVLLSLCSSIYNLNVYISSLIFASCRLLFFYCQCKGNKIWQRGSNNSLMGQCGGCRLPATLQNPTNG